MFCKIEWKRQKRKDPAYKARENELQAIRRAKNKTSLENPEKVRERVREWKKQNPARVNAAVAARKKHIKLRTPKWLTEVDFERIENEYKVAALLTKVTGKPWHVDHIYPLLGKNVSGLHVPSNLRAIEKEVNLAKSNRFEV